MLIIERSTDALGCVWRSELELAALPRNVSYARKHVRFVLHEWGLDDSAEAIELVVSELVTNAVRATNDLKESPERGTVDDSPKVQLWLHADEGHVCVQVWDANNEMSLHKEFDPSAENGRGLLIVDSICEGYGVYGLESGCGKIVWGRVRVG
ncbi:MAG TPA: ATP-binding protein [Streptosporangiaceae bacterium]|nr:ATP-binding protein [Streptosporangiaceae bacterium]